MTLLTSGRVLVTGADGFIGGRLVRRLTDSDIEVIAVHRATDSEADLRDERSVVADLRTPGALDDLTHGVEVIVHLAARSGGIGFQTSTQHAIYTDNVAMTRTVLDAAQRNEVPTVFLASSAVVYALDAPSPTAETGPLLRPDDAGTTPYAWSKLTDEALGGWARAAGVQVCVGRFGNIYGPGGSTSTVIHALAARAANASPGTPLEVWGDGRPLRTFLHVDDAVSAILATLARSSDVDVINIASDEVVSIAGLARRIADLYDLGQPVFDESRPSGPPARVLDVTRLHDVGFTPSINLSSGLRDLAASHDR